MTLIPFKRIKFFDDSAYGKVILNRRVLSAFWRGLNYPLSDENTYKRDGIYDCTLFKYCNTCYFLLKDHFKSVTYGTDNKTTWNTGRMLSSLEYLVLSVLQIFI